MGTARLKNWEAAFSLPDAARERVLCTSRLLRHRPSLTAHQATIPTPITPTDPPPSSSKMTHNLLKSNDDFLSNDCAVPPPSLRQHSTRKTRNPRNKTTQRRSNASGDSIPCGVSCSGPAEVSSPKKQQILGFSHSSLSSPEDAENADHDAGMAASISTHASTAGSLISHTPQSQRKRTKVCVDNFLAFDEKMAIRLEAEFFQCDALELAPKLLGKFLRRDEVVLQITEVEAYRPNDSACHGRFGVTPRTAPVFGPGGHAYVYLCYGLHIMLNVVADVKGVGAAVLIRACAPMAGMQTIQSRRGISTNKPILLTGPGKVGQALGLTTDWSNHPLYTSGGLEILDGPPPEKILVGPRVGIDYADPADVSALWRFAISGTPWISAPRNTLSPAL